MNLLISNVPNVLSENIDKSKIDLADKILSSVYPLFDEVHNEKTEKINELKDELKIKKKKVLDSKDKLSNLNIEYKRKKKVEKLLDRLSKLVTSGIVNMGGMKNETVILLKVIDKLSDEKLDHHLKQTLSIISKRF